MKAILKNLSGISSLKFPVLPLARVTEVKIEGLF